MEYLRGNQTTWANTDTGISPLTSCEPDLQQRIAIREMEGGGGEFNDFINHLGNMEELNHEKWMKESIVELKSLIQRHRINNNNSTNKQEHPDH